MNERLKPYGHSTIIQVAQVAKDSSAKHLIVQHISARFLSNEANNLKNQALHIFPIIEVAEDFVEYEWKKGILNWVIEKRNQVYKRLGCAFLLQFKFPLDF